VTIELRVYQLVRRVGRMTPRDVSDRLGLNIGCAASALQGLYKDDALMRELAPHSGGLGRRAYAYWVDPAKKLCVPGCECELCVPNIVGRDIRGA
jgi:hypothetical protein